MLVKRNKLNQAFIKLSSKCYKKITLKLIRDNYFKKIKQITSSLSYRIKK
jgi:hypothetical protein